MPSENKNKMHKSEFICKNFESRKFSNRKFFLKKYTASMIVRVFDFLC